MLIGAHDTATANKPRYWWGYITLPISRCQKRTVKELIGEGVRCLDLRITFDRDGKPGYAHGITRFKGDPMEDIGLLSTVEDGTARMILEDTGQDERKEELFKTFCSEAERLYPGVRFFGGNRRSDWKQVYRFAYEPKLLQLVGSMADDARWYERIFPKLYARRMNDVNMSVDHDADIVLYDFL